MPAGLAMALKRKIEAVSLLSRICMMSPEKKIIWQQQSPRFNRPFLQPLAVGLVCAVLIALILMMGIMDLRRSERTLIGFMEDQGNRIIEVVERLTEENLKTMIIASQRTTGGASVPLTEQVLSPQKLLTEAIVAMGREIDNRWTWTSSSSLCSISSRTRWSRSAVRGRRSRSCLPRRDTKTRGQYLIGHGEA